MKKFLLLCLLTFLVLSNSSFSYANSSCAVSEEKLLHIKKALCGSYSVETEYKDMSNDCVRKVFRKRADDTAAQINALRKCGYREISEELKNATIKSLAFITPIARCVDQQFDADKILRDAIYNFDTKTKKIVCSNSLKYKVESRMEFFRKSIKSLEMPEATQGAAFSKLGIAVDLEGRVTELPPR